MTEQPEVDRLHRENGPSAAQDLWVSSPTRRSQIMKHFGSDFCSSLTINFDRGAIFASPQKLLSPHSSPEERAIEEVLREERIAYTRPEMVDVAYHSSRPDFYPYIDGLGCISLEIKNRKATSYQGEAEGRRDFNKQSPYPVFYWGSYNLNNSARNQVIANPPSGSTLCRPIGFKYEENPQEWQEEFRSFILSLRDRGAMLLRRRMNGSVEAGGKAMSIGSPVGKSGSLGPSLPSQSGCFTGEPEKLSKDSTRPQSSAQAHLDSMHQVMGDEV